MEPFTGWGEAINDFRDYFIEFYYPKDKVSVQAYRRIYSSAEDLLGKKYRWTQFPFPATLPNKREVELQDQEALKKFFNWMTNDVYRNGYTFKSALMDSGVLKDTRVEEERKKEESLLTEEDKALLENLDEEEKEIVRIAQVELRTRQGKFRKDLENLWENK